jgi:hypothetical protein
MIRAALYKGGHRLRSIPTVKEQAVAVVGAFIQGEANELRHRRALFSQLSAAFAEVVISCSG